MWGRLREQYQGHIFTWRTNSHSLFSTNSNISTPKSSMTSYANGPASLATNAEKNEKRRCRYFAHKTPRKGDKFQLYNETYVTNLSFGKFITVASSLPDAAKWVGPPGPRTYGWQLTARDLVTCHTVVCFGFAWPVDWSNESNLKTEIQRFELPTESGNGPSMLDFHG